MRCSDWARTEHLDPIGTAGTYDGYLLVEWPLPWPRDFNEIPALARLKDKLAESNTRLQGLVARGDTTERVVVHYRRAPERGAGFVRREAVVGPDKVVEAATDLLEGRSLAGDQDAGAIMDVLVCTHGQRDRCCGSRGTELAMRLLADPSLLGPGVRLWRTSHTGGHRFAPTALVFPEGTAWAFADVDLLAAVVQRRGAAAELVDRYRGYSGLDSRAAQVVERAALADAGWDLLTSPRWSRTDGDETRLVAELPSGRAEWSAVVEASREVPVPDCGKPVSDAKKTDQELSLSQARRVA